MNRPLKLFVVVGEESGDQLGAGLVDGLRGRIGDDLTVVGLAGTRLTARGVVSLFPLEDIAVMGLSAVLARLPSIVRRVHETVDAVLAAKPDVLVIIDSPDFTHAVAKRVRRRDPSIPIVGYVSPSVWAWRPGRAERMARYVDHLLAILPFEPEVHARLGGPACTYVGHPLAERPELRAAASRGPSDPARTPTLLVLPGSRRSEISRLLEPFGATLAKLAADGVRFEAVLPAVPHLEAEIRAATADWAVQPLIVSGEAAKFAAFARADAALAASGTVTLELGLAGVPMVVAYRLDWFFRRLKDLTTVFPSIAKAKSMVLANIILGTNVVPEFLDDDVKPETLAPLLAGLLAPASPTAAAQRTAFADLRSRMALPGDRQPSDIAAEVVLRIAARRDNGAVGTVPTRAG